MNNSNKIHALSIESQFIDASRAAGINLPTTIIADGALHRCHLDGHKSGTQNGAYILHMDGHPAGWAFDHKTGQSFNWGAGGKRSRLSNEDKAAIEEERHQRDAEQLQKHRRAHGTAKFILNKSKPINDSRQFPYLVKKNIQPHDTYINRYQDRLSLVIPVRNDSGILTSLQFIDSDGGKRFLPGGEIKGCFFEIGISGQLPESCRILICEGFATGASLNEWYKQPVIVAFNAGNLEPVAQRIRARYPNHEIIICGDHDESGVGQKKARAAALACGGKYLLPPIEGYDFNDIINTWRDSGVRVPV